MTLTDKKDDFLKAKKIENGIVIDHLPAGSVPKVMELLGVKYGYSGEVSAVMNVPSAHYDKKDILKLEGKALDAKQVNKIALIAPNATINTVKSFVVVDKRMVQVPKTLENVVNCPNGNCITNMDGNPRLLLEQAAPLKLRCAYCEKVYSEQDLKYS